MFFLLAAFLALISMSLAAPTVVNATSTSVQPTPVTPLSALQTTNCTSDNFVLPWEITNLVIITPVQPDTAYQPYVSFAFYDPNQQLTLVTNCYANLANGAAELANGGYLACQDETVRFQLQADGLLLISRWYKDPCMGPPPYDSGIAFGQQTANFNNYSSSAGALRWQQQMMMNVTRMS